MPAGPLLMNGAAWMQMQMQHTFHLPVPLDLRQQWSCSIQNNSSLSILLASSCLPFAADNARKESGVPFQTMSCRIFLQLALGPVAAARDASLSGYRAQPL